MHQDDINGNQPGDPDKAAAAIIKVAESGHPPVHLFLGQDAYDFAQAKIKIIENDLEQWKETTLNTGF